MPEPDDRTGFVGTLEIDISCTRCGYNLRSLAADGLCPECSEPVSASLNSDRLMFTHPTWLSGMASGLTVVLWSLVLCFFVDLSLEVGPMVWAAWGYAPLGVRTVVHEFEGGRAMGTYNVIQDMSSVITRPVFLTMMMVGVYMSTRRDESEGASRIGRRKRLASRGLAILCGLVALMPLLLYNQVTTLVHKMPSGVRVGSAMPNLRDFLFLALIISLSLVVPAFFFWLAHVAGRIPDARLVRWCRRLGIMYATLTIVNFLLHAVLANQTRVVGRSLRVPLALGFVANVIGIVVLIVVYRRTMRRLISACLLPKECFVHEG